MANWGDTFSDAFTKSYVQRAQNEFDKWKYNKENDPKVITERAQALMAGYLAAQNSINGGTTPPPMDTGNINLGGAGIDFSGVSGSNFGGLGGGGASPFLMTPSGKSVVARANPLYQAQVELMKNRSNIGQATDIAKQLREGANNFPAGTSLSMGGLTTPINREFTEGESKTASNANALVGQIGKLKEMVTADMEAYKKGTPGYKSSQFQGSLPFGGFNESGQRYQLTRADAADRILRLRSGAQINEKEMKRLQKLLTEWWRSDKVDLEQLDIFEKEFSEIKNRIDKGALWDEDSKKFKIGDKEYDPYEGRTISDKEGNRKKREGGKWVTITK